MLARYVADFIALIENTNSEAGACFKKIQALDEDYFDKQERLDERNRNELAKIDDELERAIAKADDDFETERAMFASRMKIIDQHEHKIPDRLRAAAVIDHDVVSRGDFDEGTLWPLAEQILDDGVWNKLKARVTKVPIDREKLAGEYLTQIGAWREKTRQEHEETNRLIIAGKREAEKKARKAEEALRKSVNRDDSKSTEEYERRREDLVSELRSVMVPAEFKKFTSRARSGFSSMMTDFESLDAAGVPDSMAKGIFLGTVSYSIPDNRFKKVFEAALGSLCDFPRVKMPLHLPAGGSFIVLAEAFDDHERQSVLAGTRSLISRAMVSYPLEGIEVSYIDPIDRGSNLRFLEELASSPECSAIRSAVASESAIERELEHLEQSVDSMSIQLANSSGIDEYNEGRHAVLPHRLVVINDFPSGFTRKALSSLSVLLNNRSKCGISFVLFHDPASDLEKDAKEVYERIADEADIFIENDKVEIDGEKYLFEFGTTGNPSHLIENVRQAYAAGRALDTSFDRVCDFNSAPAFGDSTKGLFVPFAVDRQNEVVELELGTSSAAHMVITGSTGSGKSTTLHAIIAGLMLTYHPDDVELWLVDYKETEFAEYLSNRFPAVKLIGLDKSKEFTYALVDRISDEMLRRASMFAKLENAEQFMRDDNSRKALASIGETVDEISKNAPDCGELARKLSKSANYIREASETVRGI